MAIFGRVRNRAGFMLAARVTLLLTGEWKVEFPLADQVETHATKPAIF